MIFRNVTAALDDSGDLAADREPGFHVVCQGRYFPEGVVGRTAQPASLHLNQDAVLADDRDFSLREEKKTAKLSDTVPTDVCSQVLTPASM